MVSAMSRREALTCKVKAKGGKDKGRERQRAGKTKGGKDKGRERRKAGKAKNGEKPAKKGAVKLPFWVCMIRFGLIQNSSFRQTIPRPAPNKG